jgi:hypothetical protein
MESLEDYRLVLNQLFESVQNANKYVLTNNLIELNKTQDLIDQQAKELRTLLSLTKITKLDKEVSRWHRIRYMLDLTQKNLNNKQAYEMKNILERWLLTLANDKEDDIFSEKKLDQKYPVTEKMLSEMKEKKIPVADNKFGIILLHARTWLSFTSYPSSKTPIIFDEDGIRIDDYVRILPPGKLKILLQMNDSLELLGIMIMRYACLLPGGQQWALPLEMHQYLVNRYQVTIEGFASPINSQILNISKDLHYCSLFHDTDKYYGSLGDFFSVDFTGKNVYANPPYVLDIMNRTAVKIIQICSSVNNSFVRFFITVPEWTDAEYYSMLMNSPFLVFHHGFAKGQHYYVDTNNGFEKVPAYFGTHLFIMAVNVTDTYDEFVTFAEKVYKENK